MSTTIGSPRLAISTVCLSGTLEDKLRAAAAAGFTGVEMLEYDLVMSPWSPRRVADEAPGLGLSIEVYQPFHVETVAARPVRGEPASRRAEVRPAGAARCERPGVLLVENPRGPRRRRPGCGAAARAGRPRRAAGTAARLRGRAVGSSAHARGCLADRRASRPSGTRDCASTASMCCRSATIRPAIAKVGRRQGVPRPARRCTAAEHGHPRVEPPPPDVPRPGLARRGGLPPPGPGHRLRRPDGSRGVQRRLPAGGSEARRHRCDALHARARRGCEHAGSGSGHR